MKGTPVGKALLLFGLLCTVSNGLAAAGGVTEAEKILIGCIQDPSSAASVAVRKGAETAAAGINAAGGLAGKPVELRIYDIKKDPQEALSAYIRLADQDKVVAVIAPSLGSVDFAVANLAAAKKVSVLGSSSDRRLLLRRDGSLQPYLFLPQLPAARLAETAAGYAYYKLDLKTAAVFYDRTNDLAAAQGKAFSAYWERNGGKIAGDFAYNKGETDFTPQLSKIKASGAEVLFVWTGVQDLVLVVKQADGIGLGIPLLGGPDFAPPFASLLSDSRLADRIYFTGNYSEAEAGTAEVREAFKGKFNEEPTPPVYFGYDSVLLLVDAVKRTESVDPQEIRAALEKSKDVPGLAGPLTLSSKTHQAEDGVPAVYALERGNYRDLGRFAPEAPRK